MDFLQHTTNWIKGEIFEATIFGSFGLFTMICSSLLWMFGDTPNAKALVIPLAVVGLFFFVTAISGVSANKKKLPQYIEAYHKDKVAFVNSENARVEGFQYLYKMTIGIAAFCFVFAISGFIFSHQPIIRAIAIALVIFGVTGLVIDYFSKERADAYYKQIKTEIKSNRI